MDAQKLGKQIRAQGKSAQGSAPDPGAVLADLRARPEMSFLHRPASLEDVFLKLTGRDLRD